MSRDDSALFVNSAGEKDTNIGRSVTYFFERTLNLHITTTAIRSLIETNAEDALQSNRITTKDRIAISNMNGHSSQTVRDYYLKHSTERNVTNAVRAFSQLGDNAGNNTHINNEYHDTNNSRNHREYNNSNSYSNSQITDDYYNDGNDDYDNDVNYDENDISYNNTNFKTNSNDDLHDDDDDDNDDDEEEEDAISWGLNHPDYHLALDKRARWSKAELNYIKRWIKHDRASNSIHHHYWPAARCLKQVRSDPEAKSIFHQRHILKSDRLRVGLETCMKLLGLK